MTRKRVPLFLAFVLLASLPLLPLAGECAVGYLMPVVSLALGFLAGRWDSRTAGDV